MTAQSNRSTPTPDTPTAEADPDLEPGGGVVPGATPPADPQTSLASQGRQTVPQRFSPTTVTVLIIVGIIVLLSVAGVIAVVFDAFQLFT